MAETRPESPDFATLRKISSFLESHEVKDTIKLSDVGLVNLTKRQLDCLFVHAAVRFGENEYNPRPRIHLLVLKTLLKNGADISSMWRSDDFGYDEAPFVEMFDRSQDTWTATVKDIEFLIKKKQALSNLLEDELGQCFSKALFSQDVRLLRILIDNGAIMPGDRVLHELDWVFEVGQYTMMERVGLIFDLIVGGKTTVDLKKITTLEGFIPEVPTTVLQSPICDFLNYEERDKDCLKAWGKQWDFYLGKGHLAPPPEAFRYALTKGKLGYVFCAVYLCLARGIQVEFPDLKMADICEFDWTDTNDWRKQLAVLLQELIHRSGYSCPHSFLLTLSEISGAGRKVPSLKNISVAATRKGWLVSDKEERFSSSIVVLRRAPVQPRLVLPPMVRNLIPPALCDVVLLNDLRKDDGEISESLLEEISESETDTDSD